MLRSSADLQLYDSEFQTEGALTLSLTVLEILYVLLDVTGCMTTRCGSEFVHVTRLSG